MGTRKRLSRINWSFFLFAMEVALSEAVGWEDLPDEILAAILGFLDPGEHFFARSVCRRWRECMRIYLKVERTKTTGKYATATVSLAKFSLETGLSKEKMAKASALNGRLDVLKWARANGCSLDNIMCVYATRGGHLEMLKWLKENGCHWDGVICAFAADHGHIHILQWARENNYPWGELACASAAENGHLNVLQWARENDCPWDEITCVYAAGNGHLGILQWARSQGCPWDKLVCEFAAENGHLDVLQWARENGCPE